MDELPGYIDAFKGIVEALRKACDLFTKLIKQGVSAYDEVARRSERHRLADIYSVLVDIDAILNPSLIREMEALLAAPGRLKTDLLNSADVRTTLRQVTQALLRVLSSLRRTRSEIIYSDEYENIIRVLSGPHFFAGRMRFELNNWHNPIRQRELLAPVLAEYKIASGLLSELRPKIAKLIAELDA